MGYGYWRVWTAQQLITYHSLLPFLLLPLFTDVQLPFSCVYYISPLLYSDSESGSGDTQSSSCGSSQLRAHAPSILHPVLHPMPSYNRYTTATSNYALVAFIVQRV